MLCTRFECSLLHLSIVFVCTSPSKYTSSYFHRYCRFPRASLFALALLFHVGFHLTSDFSHLGFCHCASESNCISFAVSRLYPYIYIYNVLFFHQSIRLFLIFVLFHRIFQPYISIPSFLLYFASFMSDFLISHL